MEISESTATIMVFAGSGVIAFICTYMNMIGKINNNNNRVAMTNSNIANTNKLVAELQDRQRSHENQFCEKLDRNTESTNQLALKIERLIGEVTAADPTGKI